MADERNCSCFEVAGEDPNCILHGGGTLWRKENPDFCEIFDELATLRADLAKAVEGLERIEAYTRANITGMDHYYIVKETDILKELRP